MSQVHKPNTSMGLDQELSFHPPRVRINHLEGNIPLIHSGVGPWPNNHLNHLLAPQLVQFLQQNGLFHLNQIADPASTNLWQQGWLGCRELEIPTLWTQSWNRHITALWHTHIKLTDKEDELVWEHAAHGIYTPKTRYQQLCLTTFQTEPKWWQPRL